MASVKLAFSGMNNRAGPESLPGGTKEEPARKLRNAINVQFDNAGKLLMPRAGKTLRYAGTAVHSLYVSAVMTLFVEDGELKQLNADNTATTLKSGMGHARVSYTAVGDTVYFANSITSGKVRNGVASSWGTARPPRQPECIALASGEMLAGEYRVAITWIADEESGSGMGKRVTVGAGGGIRLTNFPVPPAEVTAIGVYVSSVNGKALYLYGEFPANSQEIYLERKLATIPLTTQFGFVPAPVGLVVAHYGRIYYSRGARLYATEQRRYGLQKANAYWLFDSDIQTVVSCPGILYIGTQCRIYKVMNIDGDGAPLLEVLQDCGTTRGSECYDPDGVSGYFMSDRGFIKATPEGLVELTHDQVAMPFFEVGAMTVIERDGLSYLVGAFQDGEQNNLANTAYNAGELARNSL